MVLYPWRMEKNEIYDELLKEEKRLSVSDFKYKDIELWRLFRFECRGKYVQKYCPEYSKTTRRVSIIGLACFKLYLLLKSLVQLLYLLLRKKKVSNVVFAFPRLQLFNDKWTIDKFTDPVIDGSLLSKDGLILQQSGRIWYFGKQRYQSQRVVQIDCIRVIANLCSLFLLLLFPIVAVTKNIYLLWMRVRETFGLSWHVLLKWYYLYHSFIIQAFLYRYLFKRISCRNIFVVNRLINISRIYAAHKLGILVYEFQHGVTHGESELYSGEFNTLLDPDYFLNFSKIWRGTQFSMPLDRQICIGWGYRKFVEQAVQNDKFSSNTVLVISSPEITEKVINTIIELAQNNVDVSFHIRCHPQETISDTLKITLKGYTNIKIADNSIDSCIALSSYQHVLGENSSVLYEALDMEKNVGRFSYNGFTPFRTSDKMEDAFFYLYDSKDLLVFLHRNKPIIKQKNYEDFDSQVFNELISK